MAAVGRTAGAASAAESSGVLWDRYDPISNDDSSGPNK